MKCNKCWNKQFYTKYNKATKEREYYICSECGAEFTEIKSVKKKWKTKSLPEEMEILDNKTLKGD